MFTCPRASSLLIVVFLALAAPSSGPSLNAQTLPALFESGRPGAQPTQRPVLPHQARKARLRLEALDAPAFRLNLFDNADRIAYRGRADDHGNGRYTWVGTTDDGGVVTFAVVNGVTTGTVYLDGRSFEITPDEDGEHTIEELNAAAFPTEEGPGDVLDAGMAPDAGGEGAVASDVTAGDTLHEIGVMVLWTPAARSAAGGQANIESLILAAVNNANLAYGNSLVNARLKLVYSAEVPFTETPSNMSGDLSALRGTTDGRIDDIHSLRDQYGADVVSLIGNGYASAGYCGLGYLMSSPSTSFAGSAFNIVDRTCAAGYLSFAHEVGHNQGLHHDPANAGSTPSYNYAYGYQDPGNAFRTVMSYGGATRVPYLSSPSVFYNGLVTGTSSQDNARALNNNAATVAAFKGGSSGGTTPTPTCSYSVSPTSLSFPSESGTASVTVTTSSGCSWSSSSGSSWAGVSGSGNGSGTATVSVSANGGASRSASVTVAGQTVAVSQAAATTTSCSYSVTPTSLSFTSAGGSATVSVSTTAGCAWSSSGSTSWATVNGSGNGAGTATVSVSSTNGGSRSGSVTVAGKSVSVSQSGATKGGGKNGGEGGGSRGGGNKK